MNLEADVYAACPTGALLESVASIISGKGLDDRTDRVCGVRCRIVRELSVARSADKHLRRPGAIATPAVFHHFPTLTIWAGVEVRLRGGLYGVCFWPGLSAHGMGVLKHTTIYRRFDKYPPDV